MVARHADKPSPGTAIAEIEGGAGCVLTRQVPGRRAGNFERCESGRPYSLVDSAL